MHIPVLTSEVLEYLDVQPDRNYIDATINGGGHTRAILELNAPHGKILGIDLDSAVIKQFRQETDTERVILEQGNFADIEKIVQKHNFGPVHGILFDLGFSSWHLKSSGRGFSFQKDEPLLMTYDSANPLTAEKIVNTWREKDIENVLRECGEERFAKPIAREIVSAREGKPIESTFDLVSVILDATPGWYQRRKIHAATKTFQALRMAVNRELENLAHGIVQALEVLAPSGRLVLISFHSLEDRTVKNFFRESEKTKRGQILTKKPITPTFRERSQNPRARSAKLRVLEKR